MAFADKGYQGAGGTVRTPHERHHPRPALSGNQKAVNRFHAKIRALGERANATLKTWKVLDRLHCCPQRATAILAAILSSSNSSRIFRRSLTLKLLACDGYNGEQSCPCCNVGHGVPSLLDRLGAQIRSGPQPSPLP